MSLGTIIRDIRKSKGYSIMKIKELTGLSKSTISEIENDKSSPTTATLEKIANVLGVPVTDFFEEKAETEKEKNEQLNDKDKKSIDKDLNNIMQEFREGTDGTAYYNGVELEESDLDLIESAMNIALEQIKIKNKEKYTPKKYKK